MPELTRDGEVAVLDLGADENRVTPDWAAEVHRHLDDVVATEGPRALVTTGSGPQYSSGLDLAWIAAEPANAADRLTAVVHAVQGVYVRLLELPLVTVAAIPGHAFAAGAMLALCHDLRVMRADRGFWCVPEVDLGMAFTPGMSALLQARLRPEVAHEAMVTGRRFGGQDAAAAGIVDLAVPEDEVLPTAVTKARQLAGKPGHAVATIRTMMYAPAIAALGQRDTISLPS